MRQSDGGKADGSEGLVMPIILPTTTIFGEEEKQCSNIGIETGQMWQHYKRSIREWVKE